MENTFELLTYILRLRRRSEQSIHAVAKLFAPLKVWHITLTPTHIERSRQSETENTPLPVVPKMIRPLSKEEETDAEVTWEDQDNINTFSKLHNKLLDLQDLLTEKNVCTIQSVHSSKLALCTTNRRHISSRLQMRYKRLNLCY